MALGQVCTLQRQYGKMSADLETLVEGFCWALEGYSMEVILDAIRQYVLRKPDIPTPSDILNIIAPSAQPLSGAVYTDIKRRVREDVFVSRDERTFCVKYEAQEIAKAHDCSERMRRDRADE